MRVLVLVAHPDDETIGAGGYICKLAEEGHEIFSVCVGNGIFTKDVDNVEDRTEGFHRACEILGCKESILLEWNHMELEQHLIWKMNESVQALKICPDLVISHYWGDLNNDHRIVSDIARIISRPSGGKNQLISFETVGDALWGNVQFQPNYFVDMQKHWEKKVEALHCYPTVLRKFPHHISAEALETLAKFRGVQSGNLMAEGFYAVRVYG